MTMHAFKIIATILLLVPLSNAQYGDYGPPAPPVKPSEGYGVPEAPQPLPPVPAVSRPYPIPSKPSPSGGYEAPPPKSVPTPITPEYSAPAIAKPVQPTPAPYQPKPQEGYDQPAVVQKPPPVTDYAPPPKPVTEKPYVPVSEVPYEEPKADQPEAGYDETEPADESGCVCVPYYQCEDGKIVTDGAGIIDPRSKRPPSQQIPLEEGYAPPFCGAYHVCCSDPEQVTQKPYVHKCGVRNPSGINKRILTPSDKGEADFGEWPWQAAILKQDEDVNVYQCGGVLIDDQHLLTVAHCVAPYAYPQRVPPVEVGSYGEPIAPPKPKKITLKVRLGEWDTQSTKEFLPHEDYTVEKIAIHPGYQNRSLWNDIAVLTLDRKVDFKPNIDTICLPGPDEVFDGQNCVTTGWGKNAYRGGSYSNVLKEINMPVVPYAQCLKGLRSTRLGPRFRLHNSFICAGGEAGRDACKGDGGGPLACYRRDGTYALAGLVAWGIDCGSPGVPGVYVKVQKFLPWISQQTGNDLSNYRPASSDYLEPQPTTPKPVPPPPAPQPDYQPPAPLPSPPQSSGGY